MVRPHIPGVPVLKVEEAITRSIKLANELGYDLRHDMCACEYVPLFIEMMEELKELRARVKK